MCRLDEDQQQHFISSFTYTVDVIKLVFGCLLSVVVPQRCTNRSDELCTLYDNFFELISYNVFTLTYNFITMGCLIGFYTIEYKRERWCIDYLDYRENEPHDGLEQQIKRYPTLLTTLLKYNQYYYWIAYVCQGLVVSNILFSSFLVFYYYYLDYRSITAMITNSLLVVEKLYASYKIAKSSNEERCAISAYLIVPITYNCMDEDYLRTASPAPAPASPSPSPSPASPAPASPAPASPAPASPAPASSPSVLSSKPVFRVQVNLATFQKMMELYHRPYDIKKK
jgi:hypothetical protein